MKIDPSKKYRTRCGSPVTCLHRAPEGWPTPFPWRGAIDRRGSGVWTDDGSFTDREENHRFDLIEVREPMRLRMLVKDEFNMRWIYTSTDVDDLIKDGWTLKEFVEVMP
jgi:hypothetical protein